MRSVCVSYLFISPGIFLKRRVLSHHSASGVRYLFIYLHIYAGSKLFSKSKYSFEIAHEVSLGVLHLACVRRDDLAIFSALAAIAIFTKKWSCI